MRDQYISLARKYQPEKHDPHVTGLTSGEAEEFFKLINNEHNFLSNIMQYILTPPRVLNISAKAIMLVMFIMLLLSLLFL